MRFCILIFKLWKFKIGNNDQDIIFNKYIIFEKLFISIPDGLAVRIPGFHPGGPGSTPGLGSKFLEIFYFQNLRFSHI